MNSGLRNISIDTELQNIGRFFYSGVTEIRKITAAYDFYHAPLIFFSSGFERLFKVCLCLDFLQKEGIHPNDFNQIFNRNKGHDIVELKQNLTDKLNIGKIPEISIEENYFINNEIFNKIIISLSEYGKKGRYFDLDQIFGRIQVYNLTQEWSDLEHFVLKNRKGDNYLEIYNNNPNQLFKDSSEIIIESIARGLNFIYNHFKSGILSDFYKFYKHHLIKFNNIEKK